MTEKKAKTRADVPVPHDEATTHAHHYDRMLSDISDLLEQARRSAALSVNSILTAAYWEIGCRIVKYEQVGRARAVYDEKIITRLSADLTKRHGRGFSERNLRQMRAFYLGYEIRRTASAKLEAGVKWTALSDKPGIEIRQTVSAESTIPSDLALFPLQGGTALSDVFPLSWSHYVRLMSVEKTPTRVFYETEAFRGGWSVRQLDRQIGTQFYEWTAHSKNLRALKERGKEPQKRDLVPRDIVPVEDEIRDPYLLEFLNLKDEYSETDLEEALIRHMEWFLLEIGAVFTFVARQKRTRVGASWYRIDLLLYHRGLIDLCIDK